MTQPVTVSAESTRGSYAISCNPADLDLKLIHQFLTNSYWSKGIGLARLNKSLQNSTCFGVYDAGGKQVGFARVITDQARIAYLADVFILPPHRGRGLSKWLLEYIFQHPDLQGLKWFLATDDAHGLYRQYGFHNLKPVEAENLMIRPASS